MITVYKIDKIYCILDTFVNKITSFIIFAKKKTKNFIKTSLDAFILFVGGMFIYHFRKNY